MSDQDTLPTDPRELTPEQARDVEAGIDTDLLCNVAVGQIRVLMESEDAIGFDDRGARCLNNALYRVSRRANGAHCARQYLRSQGYEVEMRERADGDSHFIVMTAVVDGEHGKRPVDFGLAGDEFLATARLLLVLVAEGVLEVPDE